MFVWAPFGCPPFRPEALQPAEAGHNDFGTVQEGGYGRRFHAEVMGAEPGLGTLFLVGDSLVAATPVPLSPGQGGKRCHPHARSWSS